MLVEHISLVHHRERTHCVVRRMWPVAFPCKNLVKMGTSSSRSEQTSRERERKALRILFTTLRHIHSALSDVRLPRPTISIPYYHRYILPLRTIERAIVDEGGYHNMLP